MSGLTLAARGGGQGQEGSEALSTCGDEVGGHRIEEALPGQDHIGEQGLDPPQALLQERQIEGL